MSAYEKKIFCSVLKLLFTTYYKIPNNRNQTFYIFLDVLYIYISYFNLFLYSIELYNIN